MATRAHVGIPKRRSSDLVAIIEAAYAPASSPTHWLTMVLDAFRSSYLGGAGCYAYTFRRTASRWEPGIHVLAGLPGRYRRYLRTMMEVEDPAFIAELYDGPPCTTLSSVTGLRRGRAQFPKAKGTRELDAAMQAEGLRDQLGLRAEDGSGNAVLIGAPLPAVTRLSRRETGILMWLMAHVAAGYRLNRTAGPAASDDDAEAVLTPTGRVAHATGEALHPAAREALTRAAGRRARARGRLRHEDAAGAVEIWRALVNGRWSLVDKLDHDGRRYLIAKPNPVRPPSTGELPRRQREVVGLAALGHSNKLIAYELGLSISTVSAYLVSAARTLGVSSRVDLVRIYNDRAAGS